VPDRSPTRSTNEVEPSTSTKAMVAMPSSTSVGSLAEPAGEAMDRCYGREPGGVSVISRMRCGRRRSTLTVVTIRPRPVRSRVLAAAVTAYAPRRYDLATDR
jgi:hypothetical protein